LRALLGREHKDVIFQSINILTNRRGREVCGGFCLLHRRNLTTKWISLIAVGLCERFYFVFLNLKQNIPIPLSSTYAFPPQAVSIKSYFLQITLLNR
jgi:hypothetical protein